MNGADLSPVETLAIIQERWPEYTQQVSFIRSLILAEKDVTILTVHPNLLKGMDSGFTVICDIGESDQAPSKSLYAMMIQIQFDNQAIPTKIRKSNFSEDYFLAISINPQ